jgi:geranylgeranyl pyrophosphate synthase
LSTAGTTPFEDVLEAGGTEVRASMDEVEQRLSELTGSHGPELTAAAADTLAAGGKRLRPLLVFICGQAGGGAGAGTALVNAGAAVELVHMATLVHDDVVDGATVRRGRPTVVAASGRPVATASGDFLFSRALALLGRNGDEEQVRVLSDACLSLARGELAQRRDAFASGIEVDRYLFRSGLKTASLFTAACRLGALAAGAGSERAGALGRFGHGIGLAFQVLDDVLDVTGPAERTGKERGSDLLEGTTTLPLIIAAGIDPALAGVDLRSLTSREQAESLCDRIAATGAIDESRGVATDLVADAKTALEGVLDPESAELLELVADRVVDRFT